MPMFSESARSVLSTILAILNALSAIASLSLVVVGLFVKWKVSEYTNLVKGYDGNTTPFLLVGVGIFAFLNNAVGAVASFLASNPLKRRTCQLFLLGYVFSTAFACLFVFTAAIMAFSHISHIEDSFHGGIVHAMKGYKSKMHLKVEIDQLQMYYSCCGNNGYTDWFKVDWITQKYKDRSTRTAHGKGKKKLTHHQSDNVPFSCCSPHARRPCIHHHVHENSEHYNYDYKKKVTLHTEGCRDTLMAFFAALLKNSAGIILLIGLFQIVLSIAARFLQTSIAEALQSDDPLAPSPGYLFKSKPKEEEEEKEKEQEESDEAQMKKSLSKIESGIKTGEDDEPAEVIYENWSPSKTSQTRSPSKTSQPRTSQYGIDVGRASRTSRMSRASRTSRTSRNSQIYMPIPQSPPPAPPPPPPPPPPM